MTFAMIKPDAVAAGDTGKIIDMIERDGFTVAFLQKVKLTKEGANILYDIHKDKPFFNEMVDFITSGPIVIMALAKDNAIKDFRELMGATNPAEAKEGTIRKLYGTEIGKNAIHGSDSIDNAKREMIIFFGPPEGAKRK